MPRVTHMPSVPAARAAVAPYNFVPLPAAVVPTDAAPPPHDRYDSGRKTGRIDCRLVTETPLYVRCPLTRQQFEQGERERGQRVINYTQLAKNTPEFFYTADRQKPVIPGSSLRGMLRSLVEIAAFGKMNRVTRRKPFFRALADSTLRDLYQQAFVSTVAPGNALPHPCYRSNIRTGFLRRRGDGWYIEECEYARIDHFDGNRLGLAAIPARNGQSFRPGRIDWEWQNQTIYVVADPEDNHLFAGNDRHPAMYLRFRAVRQASFAARAVPGAVEGTLVLTGPMQNKHMEFVFLHRDPGASGARYPAEGTLSPALIDRFHDDDQISQWQERNFLVDRPQPNSRRRPGWLRDGEPVFFLLNGDQVRFFGRAQMFRLPYEHAPYDLVPEALRDAPLLDIAEAIFGYVRGDRQASDRMRAGRLAVSDAHLISETENPWLRNSPITPHILGAPKPTTFQHYLVQESAHQLRHYSSPDAEIRGHKLYWHRGELGAEQIEDAAFVAKLADPSRRDQNENPLADTQHTRLKPVTQGMEFGFSIHFENLTDVELGALLWVLRYGSDVGDSSGAAEAYRLSLGMGKPLGMGAVRVTSEVVLSQREARYQRLLDEQGWASGDEPKLSLDARSQLVEAFTAHVLAELEEEGPFEDLARIRALRAMLRWPGPLPSDRFSRFMQIERDRQERHQLPGTRFRFDRRRNREVGNEYASRPVLPAPEQVLASAGVSLSGKSDRGSVSGQSTRAPDAAKAARTRVMSTVSHPPASTNSALAAFVQSVSRSNAGSLPNLISQWRALDPRIKRTAAEEMIAFARLIRVRGLDEKPWFRELKAYLGAPESQ